MRLKKSKRSQMEILGLAIIVILMTLAILFVLQFIIMKKPDDIRKSVTHKEIASNTVSSILDVTTDCRELSVAQLIEDCAEGGYIQCQEGNSCSYAKYIMKSILDNTLKQWNRNYYLSIKLENKDILSPLPEGGSPCPGDKTSSSPCCILPTGTGPISINLDVCS